MKIIGKILIGIVLLIVIGIGFMVYQFSSNLSVVRTGKVAEGVYALKDSIVNVFLITDGTNTFCIDAGLNTENLGKAMKELAIDPSTVKTVFFTHADGDHVAGAKLFNRAVYVLPEKEVPMAKGLVKRHLMFLNLTGKLGLPYIIIKDGETTNIGGMSIKAILTPGHTPGSTSYLVNNAYLFTGDLMTIKKGKAVVTWTAINNDTPLSLKSMKMLADSLTGVRMILTAHGGISTNFEQAMAAYK